MKTKVIPGNNEDVGLVFRASNGGLESFWEDPTSQYYTALINKEGIVILGKVNYNGNVWTLLGSKLMDEEYSCLNEYELERHDSDGKSCPYRQLHRCFSCSISPPESGSFSL